LLAEDAGSVVDVPHFWGSLALQHGQREPERKEQAEFVFRPRWRLRQNGEEI
jgi:hypothetical protein